ncbi:MAG: sulfatase/phosphatase domain-containing protein [Dokdonella sp.]
MGDRVIRGGKGLTIDTGIHVPLIGYWRGKTKTGLVTDTLVDSTDILPTIFDAIGAKLPVKVDGQSFLPQMLGQKGHPREWVYFWYNPLPGHGKEQYHKTIFALDHEYKLYSDGRLFHITADPEEKSPLDKQRAPEAYRKLQAAIESMGGN